MPTPDNPKTSNYDSLPEYRKKAKMMVFLTLLKNVQLPEAERKQIDYHKLEEEITAKLLEKS